MPNPTQLDYAAPRPVPSRDGGRAMIGWMFAGMIVVGLACPFFAMLLSGAGHGWGSACGVSLLATFTSPLSTVAWGLRRKATGKGLALLLVITAAIANILLVSFTRSEGVEYFDRVWSSLRGGVIVWAFLWAVWQVVALAALLWPGPREVPSGNER